MMTRYRFLDGMGDVVAEADFPDHPSAIEATPDLEDEDGDRNIQPES